MKTTIRVIVTLLVIGELAFLGNLLYKKFQEEPPELPTVTEVQAAPLFDFASKCEIDPPEGFSDLVRKVSSEYEIDPRILAVTVYRESRCDKWALGSSGEIGLTQVLPKVWMEDLKEAGILRRSQELWDPETNLRASAWIFQKLHKRTDGDLFSMFRRYNGRGPKARKYASEQKKALVDLEASSL